MVLLRSSTGTANGAGPSYREQDSLLDASSEFLSLEPQNESPELGKRRSQRNTGTNGAARSGQGPFSDNEGPSSHTQKTLRKRKFEDLQSSPDKSLDKTNEMNDKHEVRRLTRRGAKQEADASMNGNCNGELATSPCETSRRTRNTEKAAAHQVNGDVEVRRSGRIRRSRYSTTNQSVLFDKLITNTAEAVLQKMDHMKKMRRRRLRDLDELGVFNSTEESIDMYSRVKQKRGAARLDEETTDNQEESGETSEEGEEQDEDGDEEEEEEDDDEEEEEDDDEDGEEDNQKRYEFRQRKTVVPYQAPLAEPRSYKKRGMFYDNTASPTRRYHRFGSAGPRSPYCKRRLNRRRHAIHSSDSTSSSSDDEQHFERRLNRSRNKAISRCLPLNLQRDDLKGIQKDRMKIGASLADVDPMQIDATVRFSSVGGLSKHISSLKEMVVFPLLYPEIFEKFKIQPPRGCLFYGPPGTGKTLVARALANECSIGDRRVAFFMRKGADCLSKWVGESERQLRLLFDQAYQMRPSIIFFDEIDGLAPVRSSRQDQIHSSIVSTLLALMDGLDSRGEIVVIGATNRLDSIDPALRRPGRFDREFLFSLPDQEARKDILKIHTKEWNPKPSDLFLDELSEKCVGYCGADIKSVCAEAALCSLRRRYPQIYTTTEKLQLDVDSIKITAKDFITAMQKIVPASQRAVISPGQALSPIIQPLLQNTLCKVLKALTKIFPHALEGIKKEKQSELSNHLLDEDLLYSDDEGLSVFDNGLPNKTPNKPNRPFLQLHMSAHNHPTSYRPRLLLAGKPGHGQGTHLAPAAIHALEKFTVYTADLAVLFGVGATSPEETCAQLFREAKRTAPSILYIPHIHLWWETVSDTLKATFVTLLKSIPSFSPILLLATCDVDHYKLPHELQELFVEEYGEVFHVLLPNKEERRVFFEDLIINQAAKAPVSKKKAVLQALEVLPVAPPPEPRTLSAEELKQLEEQEESTLRELRLFLRDVSHRLAIDKRFRVFTKPVDPEEVPDYVTVIAQPMDLSTVISKIDLHKYHTVKEYLKDIDLICSNALEYNPDKDPGDRLIRHRACTLKDATYAIIKEELDEEFEKLCEEIQESRKKRGFCASAFAPTFYHVLPKQNGFTDGKKAETEKTGQSSVPLAASTPSAPQYKKKYRRKSRWSSGNCTKKKKLLPSFKNENEKINGKAESEADQENPESSLDHTEIELDSSADAGNETPAADNHTEDFPMHTLKAAVNTEEPESTAPQEPTRKEADAVENSESGDVHFMRMTRGRQLQVEQQQLVSVEEAMEVLSEATPALYVDHQKLKNLLDKAVVRSNEYNVFQLEKMYALLSQCIYRHRKDYDKTMLLKEMEDEINGFRK
ncbi:hypothetical protein XENTR_v10017249 [Xenopus tropicalis]|uniref:ATPase family AAA domain-containing protein 2 n=1 Tax=Xenopus tropicalis TaxID=8364 RepID=A0A8J1JQP9_XENTR|nr:ATPase family AAA domain-containing protein 2 isoform X2 [Xenopus tropicalis]KAE8599601.1 hypothetical protein XENTR_v10017249 [Xenopus tropicalis]